jgi:hypothetical protein
MLKLRDKLVKDLVRLLEGTGDFSVFQSFQTHPAGHSGICSKFTAGCFSENKAVGA